MPRERRIRRRPPSDQRLLAPLMNPGIIRTIVIAGSIVAVFGVGVVLMVHGMQ